MLGDVMVGSSEAMKLAREFEVANQEVLELARSCSDAQWSSLCEAERWSVGVLIDHIADSNVLIEGGVKSYLRKEEVPFTPAMVDAHTAEHAAEYASVSRDEAVRRLEDSIAKMVQTVRSLSDDELGITM